MVWEKSDTRTINIDIDKNLYEIDVIHKVAYWFLDEYTINVKDRNNSIYSVEVVNDLRDFDDEELRKFISKFQKLLIDFKTRSIIVRETKVVRELLIAKAFANSDEYDELPPGSLNDTVGFDHSDFS